MINGKGYYIWQLDAAEIPDPHQLAQELKAGGFRHAIIKVADGPYLYNHLLLAAYIDELTANQIEVWGFQYIYADDPVGEANIGIHQVQTYNLPGLIIDAESECKGKPAAIKRYMTDLRAGTPGVLLGLSSFRWPTVHPELPWAEFLARVDFVMPQVYWVGGHNPAEQLRRSIQEYTQLAPAKPYIATGAAYQEKGWRPTPGEVTEFFTAVKYERMAGCNFWEFANSRRYGLYDTVAALSWDGSTPAPDPEPDPQPDTIILNNPYSDRLNFRSAPGVSTETLRGQLLDGAEVEILERVQVGSDTWLRVRAEGYIAGTVDGRQYIKEGA